jgi:hypothetical protein
MPPKQAITTVRKPLYRNKAVERLETTTLTH